jgi:uncharacterized protein YjiK
MTRGKNTEGVAVGRNSSGAKGQRLRRRMLAAGLAGSVAIMAASWAAGAFAPYLLSSVQVEATQSGTESVLAGLVADIDGAAVEGLEANLSGLTYSASTGTLFTVINRPPGIAEISIDGRLLRYLPLEGARDPEGITHVAGDLFIIAAERDQSLHVVRIGPETKVITVKNQSVLQLDLATLPNKGLEGASWDARTGRLYLVQEMLPARIVIVEGLRAADAVMNPFPKVTMRSLPLPHQTALVDLSSVSLHEKSGHLLLLSDASGVVVEYDEEARLVGMLRLDGARNGLTDAIPQAEGLAIDDRGRVFIVSEPNFFYRFDRGAEQTALDLGTSNG